MDRSRSLVRLAPALLLVLTISTPAAAVGAAAHKPVHSLEAIEGHAADYLRELYADAGDVKIAIRPLDRRLRLARCDAGLDALLVGTGAGKPAWGASVVEVSCAGAPGWRVRVRAQSTIEREVWTLSRSVRRGDVLVPELLTRQAVTLGDDALGARRVAARAGATLPIEVLEPLLGYTFRHSLRAGSVPSLTDLQPPLLVERGRTVRLRRLIAGMSVETQVVALADGRRDERISVRNERSGRRIDAVVIGIDTVAIR